MYNRELARAELRATRKTNGWYHSLGYATLVESPRQIFTKFEKAKVRARTAHLEKLYETSFEMLLNNIT